MNKPIFIQIKHIVENRIDLIREKRIFFEEKN